MKKQGVINYEISQVIASMGHTDILVIADCGLPISKDVRRIDLAYTIGKPSFIDVLKTILEELKVEEAIIASEMKEHNFSIYKDIYKELTDIKIIENINHEEFKKITQKATAVIRTGEATPYANIILKSGVVF